jgi:hypothetical protein
MPSWERSGDEAPAEITGGEIFLTDGYKQSET